MSLQNISQGQLNNKGGGGLHETKQSQDKMEIAKQAKKYMINSKQISFEVTCT